MAANGTNARQEEELPCVWSLAGVLAYRPCDRNYECGTCPLFHALAGDTGEGETDGRAEGRPSRVLTPEEKAVEVQVSSYLSLLFRGCELHLDRYYSPNHFWLSWEGAKDVTLGLDGHVLRILYPIDGLVTPRVGLRLKQGEPCGWITRKSRAIPMTVPVAGEVKAVNESYVEAVKTQPGVDRPEDWLLRIEAPELAGSVEGLYRGEESLAWYMEKIRTLKRYLRLAIAPRTDRPIGPALPDGGTHARNLEEVLGPEQYQKLVDELL